MSRSIDRLEERLGVLLNRTTRTMMNLTNEGRVLYERASPHLEGIEAAGQATHPKAAIAVRGSLRVSVNPPFARYILAPETASLRERHPKPNLQQCSSLDVGIQTEVGIDVAVRFGRNSPQLFLRNCSSDARTHCGINGISETAWSNLSILKNHA